jgi:restriction system protein
VAQAAREAKQRHIDEQMTLTESHNQTLKQKVEQLNNLLEQALDNTIDISFENLRKHKPFREFILPPVLQTEPIPPTNSTKNIPEPDFLMKLIPGWEKRHEKILREAWYQYTALKQKYDSQVAERNEKIKKLRDEYESEKTKYDQTIQQIDNDINKLEIAYKAGDSSAIRIYSSLALKSSKYPDGFPCEFRVAYVPEPKQLVVEYELPHKRVIPIVGEYKYVKTKDVVEEKARKPAEFKDIYQNIVAGICLRTIYEVFKNDPGKNIDVVAFNGLLKDVDPATGKDIHPCLISIRTTKDRFNEINLAKVEKKACLRNLGAQVSPQPSELQAVKPVVEFDMVDKRFVEDSDILSDIESRPNLMDLNPWEFENFINNLFAKIGFEAKLTRSSKDGGVDVVAFDPRPILGGKVVIQAKRYKNVVGVSAVRDLYGTMINEGASKGILVTTSHYGPDAYDFAKDKPIELIDGGGLQYLLEQNGTKARIIFPEDNVN